MRYESGNSILALGCKFSANLIFHPVLVDYFFILIGINRHFHMACIHDKFTTSTGNRNISSEQLWQHLKELYNLPALVGIVT